MPPFIWAIGAVGAALVAKLLADVGRKERELDPAVEALRSCVAQAEHDAKLHPLAAKRLKEMLAFVDMLDRWYARMLTVPKPKLAALVRLGTRIVSLLPLGKHK